MKKPKYTDEQIAYTLKQVERGTLTGEVCRKMGISNATFSNRKKQYGAAWVCPNCGACGNWRKRTDA